MAILLKVMRLQKIILLCFVVLKEGMLRLTHMIA